MSDFLFISDVHCNYKALDKLKEIDGFNDCQVRFVGDLIDGYNLQIDDVYNTLEFVKDTCNKNGKMVLGNHDSFLLKWLRSGDSYYWGLNGMKNTLNNLTSSLYRKGIDLSIRKYLEQNYEEWLYNLPKFLKEGNIITVHAGFELDKPINAQFTDTLLWVRENYYNRPYLSVHSDYRDGVIVSGHTPTQNMGYGGKIRYELDKFDSYQLERYYIDGGSNSSSPTERLNILRLDKNGKYVTSYFINQEGLHEYEEIV